MGEVDIIGGPPATSLDDVQRKIAAYLRSTNVVRAILFGSIARGTGDVASDVDLVLIGPTPLPFVERGLEHLELFRILGSLDLLVYTPEEYDRLKREGNPLIERVEREGVMVYARSDK